MCHLSLSVSSHTETRPDEFLLRNFGYELGVSRILNAIRMNGSPGPSMPHFSATVDAFPPKSLPHWDDEIMDDERRLSD